MYCPTCGADVPESKYCQNCGSSLFVGETPDAWGRPAEQASPAGQPSGAGQTADAAPTPDAGQQPYTAQPPYPNQGAYASQAPYSGVAPSTAFVLAIIGLVLGLLGFSLVTIIPGIICCIIGLVLNSKYNKAGQYNPHKTSTTVMSVIGLIAATLSIVFFVAIGAASIWFVNEYGDKLDDAELEEIIDDFDDGGEWTPGGASGSASAMASASNVDPRVFDKRGNVTLYTLSELSGKEIVKALKARGYVWEESAQAWMASNGATFEVQDDGGMMSQDAIERISAGADGSSVAFAVLTVGYDTPAAALDALSGDVEIKDTCADEEGAIVFAIIEGTDGNKRLATISETGKKQQMVLFFTEDAVESGLFSEITGVSRGKSIDSVWKALNAK